jgi:steroid Delta-isomerase
MATRARNTPYGENSSRPWLVRATSCRVLDLGASERALRAAWWGGGKRRRKVTPLSSRGDDPTGTPTFDLDEHVRLFNAAVDSGDWISFVEQFAEDAVLEFVGPPVGPFTGRAAIHEAYVRNPPDDKIELDGPVAVHSGELVVPYKWVATGATGTMRVTERAGRIVRLVVTFN